MSDDEQCQYARPNRVKLRGYEFEEVVPWGEIFEPIAGGTDR